MNKSKWCFHYSPKKVRFVDELDAKIALMMIWYKHGYDREQYYYYHKICKGWHLTSLERKEVNRHGSSI